MSLSESFYNLIQTESDWLWASINANLTSPIAAGDAATAANCMLSALETYDPEVIENWFRNLYVSPSHAQVNGYTTPDGSGMVRHGVYLLDKDSAYSGYDYEIVPDSYLDIAVLAPQGDEADRNLTMAIRALVEELGNAMEARGL